MPLSAPEFMRLVEEENKNPPPRKICGLCPEPLISGVNTTPGEPRFITRDGQEIQVHEDCYFESFGEELEKFPIGRRVGMHGTAHEPDFD